MKKNKISKNWLKRRHKDIFFRKSKIYGYRSRSAFKLTEMDEKFKFLDTVLAEVNKDLFRPAEVQLLYGDSCPAREELGWKPEISFDKLVQRMVQNDLDLLNK